MDEFGAFVDDYYCRFVEVLQSFDREPLQGILETLERVQAGGGTVWVAGNGGSAAISDHTVCDATKGTYVDGRQPLRTVSLASNVAMLTALSNDISYEACFRQQLEYYLEPGDAVLLVSSSGNSPNVVEACRYARKRGVTTIAFVGFQGGTLRELADHVVWVPVDNYGIAEDTHQSLMHVITQYLRMRAERSQKA
ncbi:MAG: SIS domain-containing protein [Myxococcota bacterium]|jgi:phosphoheptose isomerase|nr:phosphoheptose isomerase [Deltaproteobacteria bacterium]MCP4240476.1 SIS domain-containing protein [bacterium]MDP6076448.1 SIS domain-containing protein [Myxococcota bacterium]MDP6244512.1 SIS domain-containing protein [Myxococcota bacterium]MDP7073336.1 SIS domain-containing protein [Myxococcota bacterium]